MAASTVIVTASNQQEADAKRKSLNKLAQLSITHLEKLEELARNPKAINALDKKWHLIKMAL
ncbi:hypothetical protein [Zunongwangia sp.]|uniref:hypothetical protein n=1 Tax=Zunongwangia sp. TaxID=1965325 RepID=UPI003AA7B5D5